MEGGEQEGVREDDGEKEEEVLGMHLEVHMMGFKVIDGWFWQAGRQLEAPNAMHLCKLE